MVLATGLYLSAGRWVVGGIGRGVYYVHDVEGRVEGEEGDGDSGRERMRRGWGCGEEMVDGARWGDVCCGCACVGHPI